MDSASASRVSVSSSALRLGALGVLDRVDEGDLVAARGRDRPHLVERGDRGARNVREAVFELFLGDPDLLGDLGVRRRPVELRLERGHRPLDLTRAGAHGARHPVHRAQLVDDRALDPRDRVGLELHVPVGVVALDRTDQAEEAIRGEVVLVHVGWQSAAQPPGDELHERRVGEDQAIPDGLVVRLPELAPKRLEIFRRTFGHGGRIRRAAVVSAVSPLAGPERPHAEPHEPERDQRPRRRPRPSAPRSRSWTTRTRTPRPRRSPRAGKQRSERGSRLPAGHESDCSPSPEYTDRATQGSSSMVEHRSPKPGVAGSSPVSPASRG